MVCCSIEYSLKRRVERMQTLKYDKDLTDIVSYVLDDSAVSVAALDASYLCLLDALGCAMLALSYPDCRRLLGPIIPNTQVPNGVLVPGTCHRLDPIQAAFNIGTQIRYLDFNDTWLAKEWGHPSDNLGALIAVAAYKNLTIKDLLLALIKAYEIQGVLALENSFNQLGLDHVILVKLASAVLSAKLLGGDETVILNAASQVFVDGAALRTYRHAPNTGSRKSWAAGDATARGLWLAWLSVHGEMGYPAVLSAPKWGFADIYLNLVRDQAYKSTVVENILFKLMPAEFHAQTAIEAALQLRPSVKDRLNDICEIKLWTQPSGMKIINKTGPLTNPADRDHCLQYMVAIALIYGEITSDHYQEAIANDIRIDTLRECMTVQEDREFSIANAIQIVFADGSATDKIQIDHPIGHPKRRAEALPLIINKFKANINTQFSQAQAERIYDTCMDKETLLSTPVTAFLELFYEN